MILMDCHTHTQFSVDSEADIELCARRAAELGLAAYAITDHCECNYWLPESETEYPEYRKSDSIMFGSRDYAIRSIEKTFELKERYPVLRVGTELGQMMQAPGIAAAVAGDERLELICLGNAVFCQPFLDVICSAVPVGNIAVLKTHLLQITDARLSRHEDP